MFWLILFLINLKTGEHVFSLYRLPFDSLDNCHAAISQLEQPYMTEFAVKAGCVQFPDVSEEL